jgi:hypothetical protein
MNEKCSCPIGVCNGKPFGMDNPICMMAYNQAMSTGNAPIYKREPLSEKAERETAQ